MRVLRGDGCMIAGSLLPESSESGETRGLCFEVPAQSKCQIGLVLNSLISPECTCWRDATGPRLSPDFLRSSGIILRVSYVRSRVAETSMFLRAANNATEAFVIR